jgi:hypothetical protein
MKPAKNTLILFLCILTLGFASTKLNGQAVSRQRARDEIKLEEYVKEGNVEKLIVMMQDKVKDQSLRQEAAITLGRLKDVRAIDPLIAGLNDKDIRRCSAWALGNISDKIAIKSLIVVLTDRSSLGREEAALALNQLGWEPGSDREKVYYLAAIKYWDGCLGFGNLAIEPLVYILGDGTNNARVGALEALDRYGWKPGEDDEKSYIAAKKLKAERDVIIEKIVIEEMKLKQEFENNLQKLREDQKSGKLNLSEEEFKSLEQRFTDDIIREQEEIKAFRSELSQVGFTLIKFENDTIIGREMAIGEGIISKGWTGILVHEGERGQLGPLKDIWYCPWTGKPTKEFEWKTGNFYRYYINGNKYLFAKFNFGGDGRTLLSIDILNPDGKVREKIFKYGVPDKITTNIGQNKLIEWPLDNQWATERLKFLEVELLAYYDFSGLLMKNPKALLFLENK